MTDQPIVSFRYPRYSTEQAIADFERLLELTDNPQLRQIAEEHLRELEGE